MLHLLFAAMETEKDPTNMQMLLHGNPLINFYFKTVFFAVSGLNVLFQDIIVYESSVAKMVSKESEEKMRRLSVEETEISTAITHKLSDGKCNNVIHLI